MAIVRRPSREPVESATDIEETIEGCRPREAIVVPADRLRAHGRLRRSRRATPTPSVSAGCAASAASTRWRRWRCWLL